jgi:hypothetical protein
MLAIHPSCTTQITWGVKSGDGRVMDSDAASERRACGKEGRYSTIGHRAVGLCMEETSKEEGK